MADTAATNLPPQRNPLPTILLALLGFILFGCLILLVYPLGTPENLLAKRAAERSEIRASVAVKQAKLVSDSVGFVDPEGTMLHLPQEEVIDALIKELASKPVGPSTMKVDPAAPTSDSGTTSQTGAAPAESSPATTPAVPNAGSQPSASGTPSEAVTPAAPTSAAQ